MRISVVWFMLRYIASSKINSKPLTWKKWKIELAEPCMDPVRWRVSLYPDCINAELKYNNLVGYISNSNFKFKFSNFQIFKFKTSFSMYRFLLQNLFLKLINIFVFFLFILVDAFSGSIKTEKSQKAFLP